MARQKLTAEQKQANKVEKKRSALEDAAFKAVGGRNSLFAEMVEPVTTAEAHWHMRRTKALMVEHGHQNVGRGMQALKTLNLIGIEAEAARHLDPATFAKLRTHCHTTYPTTDYFCGFWKRVLCGEERIVFGFDRVPDATKSIGIRVVEKDVYQSEAKMTPDEFYARWPYLEQPEPPESESSDAVFDDVMRKLGVM